MSLASEIKKHAGTELAELLSELRHLRAKQAKGHNQKLIIDKSSRWVRLNLIKNFLKNLSAPFKFFYDRIREILKGVKNDKYRTKSLHKI